MTARDAYFADRGMPGHWFLMCSTCPMHAEKVRDSDSPARIACMGGTIANHYDGMPIVNTCWHTTPQGVAVTPTGARIECCFDPERDLWNHPGGKVGVPKEPQTLVAQRGPQESVGDAMRRIQGGALQGTLRLPVDYVPYIKRGE